MKVLAPRCSMARAACTSQRTPRGAQGGEQTPVAKPRPFSRVLDTPQLVQGSLTPHSGPGSTLRPHHSPLSWVLVSSSPLTVGEAEAPKFGDWLEVTKLGSG